MAEGSMPTGRVLALILIAGLLICFFPAVTTADDANTTSDLQKSTLENRFGQIPGRNFTSNNRSIIERYYSVNAQGNASVSATATIPATTPAPTRTTANPGSLQAAEPERPVTQSPVSPLSVLRDRIVDSIFVTTILVILLLLVGAAVHFPLLTRDARIHDGREIPWTGRTRLFLIALHTTFSVLFFAVTLMYVQSGVFRILFSGLSLFPAFLGGFFPAYLSISSLGMVYSLHVNRVFSSVRAVHIITAGLGIILYLGWIRHFLPSATVITVVLLFSASAIVSAIQGRSRNPGTGARGSIPDTLLFEKETGDAAPPFPPELGNRYLEPRFISQGGIARVFSARRVEDGALVAVKIPIRTDEQTGRSLFREMSVWQGLNHPGIVSVKAANILPVPYMEMEYLPGSLERVDLPMDVYHAARLMESVARALAFAHDRGVIHRDLKPANILLDDQGNPKIADWGLSRDTSVPDRTTILGFSLSYAAPEQLDPKRFGRADKRTDIYQFGIIFYQLVTGRLPFPGESVADVTREKLDGTVQPPSFFNPAAQPLDDLIIKCLARDPEMRYQDVRDLLWDLEVFLEEQRLHSDMFFE